MPQKQINARDLIFQVSDMLGTPTFFAVGGITQAAIDFSDHEETNDTTTYDDAGVYGQEIMQRGVKLTISGRKKQDNATGVYDPGQGLLDTHSGSAKVGVASQVNIRLRYPVETQWKNWVATISRGEEGGSNNDKVGFSYVVTRCGATTLTAAP